MSVKIEEEVEKPVESIKQRCVKCLRGTNLLKTAVVLACTGVVVQQITTCIGKLIDVPITTYTHFDFNKTVIYPSVTFCREPPYKHDKMLENGLYAHPRFTSTWFKFNFSVVTLDELWNDITYDDQDFFAQYGLDGEMDNVEIKSTLGFVFGRCITLEPKILQTTASRKSGYSITLQHSAEDISTSTSVYPPGYHVFVHYSKEPFTEIEVYNGGLVDYLYINTGETMDVKLTVDEYFMISKADDPCYTDPDYNANTCTSQYVWDQVGVQAGCSGPWMTSNLPRCNNFTSMRSLISAYMNTYNNHDCHTCPRSCRSFLYNAFVTDRQILYTWDTAQVQWAIRTGAAALQSQLYIHFNSMMVSVYEERYNYDWNLFISDLGGSVGFLLGLSVIGLMTIFGKIWSTIIKPYCKGPKNKRDDISVTRSTVTAQLDSQNLVNNGLASQDMVKNELSNQDLVKNELMNQDMIKNVDVEFFKKCNEWNLKNNLRDIM